MIKARQTIAFSLTICPIQLPIPTIPFPIPLIFDQLLAQPTIQHPIRQTGQHQDLPHAQLLVRLLALRLIPVLVQPLALLPTLRPGQRLIQLPIQLLILPILNTPPILRLIQLIQWLLPTLLSARRIQPVMHWVWLDSVAQHRMAFT